MHATKTSSSTAVIDAAAELSTTLDLNVNLAANEKKETMPPGHRPAMQTISAASLASVCSVIAGAPFDSIKVRMQTDSHQTTRQCVQKTWDREGLRGFFRGILPPLMTVNIVKMMSVGIYEKTRSILLLDHQWSASASFFTAGFLAGTSTSFISCPLEMIRNQRILHDALIERRLKLAAAAAAAGSVSSVATASSSAVASNASADVLSRSIQRPTSFSYAKGLWQQNGMRGIYRGYHLHLARESLGTAIYWYTYETLHMLPFISPTGKREDASASGHFLAGGLTGMVAWFLIFPIDLVKNVYQKEAVVPANKRKYHGAWMCFRSIIQEKSWRGLWFGVWPTMLRAFPIHALNLFIYESALNFFEGYYS